MIKAMMNNNKTGKRTVMLGLSRMNLNRLAEGNPIHIDGKELGLDLDIAILFGETEANIYKDLQPNINDKTRVHPVRPETIQ